MKQCFFDLFVSEVLARSVCYPRSTGAMLILGRCEQDAPPSARTSSILPVHNLSTGTGISSFLFDGTGTLVIGQRTPVNMCVYGTRYYRYVVYQYQVPTTGRCTGLTYKMTSSIHTYGIGIVHADTTDALGRHNYIDNGYRCHATGRVSV